MEGVPEGGLVSRPIKGNTLFWINLHTNSTDDSRVLRVEHAGLPVEGGIKVAISIWPRQYVALTIGVALPRAGAAKSRSG